MLGAAEYAIGRREHIELPVENVEENVAGKAKHKKAKCYFRLCSLRWVLAFRVSTSLRKRFFYGHTALFQFLRWLGARSLQSRAHGGAPHRRWVGIRHHAELEIIFDTGREVRRKYEILPVIRELPS